MISVSHAISFSFFSFLWSDCLELDFKAISYLVCYKLVLSQKSRMGQFWKKKILVPVFMSGMDNSVFTQTYNIVWANCWVGLVFTVINVIIVFLRIICCHKHRLITKNISYKMVYLIRSEINKFNLIQIAHIIKEIDTVGFIKIITIWKSLH